jgi:hemolysin activation/secretion protein
VHYSLPAGYWTLAFNHSQSSYYQSVAGANANYTYSGQSDTSDIKLSTIVYRDAQAKTSLGLKAWARNSKNFVDDAEIEVQRRNVAGWELSLGHKTQIGSTTLDANLSYKRGTDDFGAQPAPEEYNQTDPNTGTARFGLSTLDASASGAFTLGTRQWNYNSALRLQNASTALTTMDRISIGGRSSVRGFDGESSLSAERGYTLRNELSLALGQSGQQIYLGVDYGEVSGPSSVDLLGRSLSGAVLGLRGELQPGYGKLQYDLFVGGPLNRPQGFKTAQTTAGFSLNWGF